MAPLTQIILCVVDTTKFPRGVFIEDSALLRTYPPGLDELLDHHRAELSKGHNFNMYFGQYLSQGALWFSKSQCQVITADKLIGDHLKRLRPEFWSGTDEMAAASSKGDGSWMHHVVAVRDRIYRPSYPGYYKAVLNIEKLEAVEAITKLFDASWRLPIATLLLALHPMTTDPARRNLEMSVVWSCNRR